LTPVLTKLCWFSLRWQFQLSLPPRSHPIDYVTLSSSNRHATAGLADVSMPDAIDNIGTKVDLLH